MVQDWDVNILTVSVMQIICFYVSVSGLQSLINTCVNYVKSHGLRFNPLKTTCFIVGNNPFTSIP